MVLNFQNIYTSNKKQVSTTGIDEVTISSNNLSSNYYEDVDFIFSPMVVATWIKSNYPSRIQVYPTPESRERDRNRDLLTSPPSDSLILLDAIFESNLELPIQIGKVWVNQDNPQTSNFYIKITNLDTVERQINAKLELSVIGLIPEQDDTLEKILIYGEGV